MAEEDKRGEESKEDAESKEVEVNPANWYQNAGSPTETPKKSWLWIKNSSGKASATITFLFVAFWVTTFMFIGGHIETVEIGSFALKLKDFDAAAAAIYYVPLMALYFKRRQDEAKENSK
jgi:hypothetical protein